MAASETRRKISGFRPLEIPPGRGRWQLDRLLTLLARLTPAPGPSLPELLISELPRLPRSLVLMLVTPRIDDAVAAAVTAVERAGIEVGVLWIADDDETATAALHPTPVYAVRRAGDLEALGERRL